MLKSEGKKDFQYTFSSHFKEKEANELEYMQKVIRATSGRTNSSKFVRRFDPFNCM